MIKVNGKKIFVEKFPNNESKVKDFIADSLKKVIIEFKFESDEDLIHLMFVKERLDEFNIKSKLFIWYMPYSRMDREITGDLFTLKYITKFLDTLNFEEIIVMEPHSNKTVELLQSHNSKVKDIYPTKDWLFNIMEEENFTENDHIVFPDKGARERYAGMSLPNLLTFDKKRNVQTGKIIGLELRESSINKGSTCIILDDLCSKGGTFMSVAQTLKNKGAERVILITAHTEDTIFKGDLLKGDSPVDLVITSKSILTMTHPKIRIMNVEAEDYVN